MVAFWYPTKIRVWRDSSTEYDVRKTKSGDILIRFKEGDTGTTGLYSLSQNKLLNFSDSRWSETWFESTTSEHGLGSIYPHLEGYSDEGQEYRIDLTYEGDYNCDPHAAAIYPTKHINQKKFGRVFIRINKIPRIATSDKYCESWAEEREQLLFVEALAPDIYRMPNGGLLLADPNFPIVFVNEDARNITDFSFCIETPYFTYAMLDAVKFSKIIEKVETQYQLRRNHQIYGSYFYANTVRKNIDLMDEVVSLVGNCSVPNAPKRTSD